METPFSLPLGRKLQLETRGAGLVINGQLIPDTVYAFQRPYR